MSGYSTLRYGASGSSVKSLQTALNKKGYKLDVDGQYGSKTQAAVKDYQTKNKLTVDGIAGNQTWTSLNGSTPAVAKTTTAKKTTTPTKTTAKKTTTQTITKGLTGVTSATQSKLNALEKGYTQSSAVTQAQNYLNSVKKTKPGEFNSQYTSQLNDMYNKIMNREKFNYDLNGDALYNQYKDQYTNLGQTAMADTMGQAAALTGGYGSSYATTAGNQAYQNYLTQLNDKVPELYAQARDQYNQEGQDMYNQYNMTNDLYQNDYTKYRDSMSDYQYNLSDARDAYSNERNFDYGKYSDNRNYYQTKAGTEQDQYNWQKDFIESQRQYNEDLAYKNAQMAYQKQRDAVADSQWAKEFALDQQQLAMSAASKASSGGGSSKSSKKSSTSSKAKSKYTGITTAMINKASSFKTDAELSKYIDAVESAGYITEGEANSLYDRYTKYKKVSGGKSGLLGKGTLKDQAQSMADMIRNSLVK